MVLTKAQEERLKQKFKINECRVVQTMADAQLITGYKMGRAARASTSIKKNHLEARIMALENIVAQMADKTATPKSVPQPPSSLNDFLKEMVQKSK